MSNGKHLLDLDLQNSVCIVRRIIARCSQPACGLSLALAIVQTTWSPAHNSTNLLSTHSPLPSSPSPPRASLDFCRELRQILLSSPSSPQPQPRAQLRLSKPRPSSLAAIPLAHGTDNMSSFASNDLFLVSLLHGKRKRQPADDQGDSECNAVVAPACPLAPVSRLSSTNIFFY
jgi:hypothetical protein